MKKIIFMLAAAATMASCSKTEIYENGQAAGPDIIAKPVHQLVSGELSRAPFIGNIAADNHLTARVLTFGASTDPLVCDGNIVFTTPTTIASYVSGQTFKAGNGKYPGSLESEYYMTGLYPAGSWSGTVSGKTSTVTHAITGHDDIMVTGMETILQADVTAKNAPTLTFKHQLTKFEVKVRAKDTDAETAWASEKVVSVKLKGLRGYTNLPDKFSYTLDGNASSYPEAATALTFPFLKIDNSGAAPVYGTTAYSETAAGKIKFVADSNTINAVAYTMVAPFVPTNAIGDVTLEVVVNAGTLDLINVAIPTVSAANTAGYAYTIVLTFADDKTIIAKAEVAEWLPGGTAEHTINK